VLLWTVSVVATSVLWLSSLQPIHVHRMLWTSSFAVTIGRLLNFASGSDKSCYMKYIILPPRLRVWTLWEKLNLVHDNGRLQCSKCTPSKMEELWPSENIVNLLWFFIILKKKKARKHQKSGHFFNKTFNVMDY